MTEPTEPDQLAKTFNEKVALNGQKKLNWFEASQSEEEKKNETTTTTKKKQDSIFKEDVDLKSQQMDKSNPLYSEVESFKDLNLSEQLLKNVHTMKWDKPSGIQAKTIPIILNKKTNIIAQSQSGTGKTGCFAIGMLSTVDPNKKVPQALCVCPSLELAYQIHGVTEKLATDTGIKVEALLKGSKYDRPLDSQILIGTPGKIQELLSSKKNLLPAKDIKMLVFDEADEMLRPNMGSLKEQSIKIKKLLPKNIRVLLFSATFQDSEDDDEGKDQDAKILEFAAKVVPEPIEKILVPKEELSLNGIRQYLIPCKSYEQKYEVLKGLYGDLTIAQCIIFVNTRETANNLTENLRKDGFTVSILHSKVDSSMRKIILQEFQDAKTKVLITTNVLSRGVDIRQVTHVINYDPPCTKDKKPDAASYLHRIGRSGRFGREGIAINLVSNDEERKILDEILKFYNRTPKIVQPDAEFDEEIK